MGLWPGHINDLESGTPDGSLPDSRGRGHDALVTDLLDLTFVGLIKFLVGNSGVMSALYGAFIGKCVCNFTPASPPPPPIPPPHPTHTRS